MYSWYSFKSFKHNIILNINSMKSSISSIRHSRMIIECALRRRDAKNNRISYKHDKIESSSSVWCAVILYHNWILHIEVKNGTPFLYTKFISNKLSDMHSSALRLSTTHQTCKRFPRCSFNHGESWNIWHQLTCSQLLCTTKKQTSHWTINRWHGLKISTWPAHADGSKNSQVWLVS